VTSSPRAAGYAATALATVPLVPAHLTVWRAVLNGRDARDVSAIMSYAGRWHDPRVTPALYTAEDRATAVAEVRYRLPTGRHLCWRSASLPLSFPSYLI